MNRRTKSAVTGVLFGPILMVLFFIHSGAAFGASQEIIDRQAQAGGVDEISRQLRSIGSMDGNSALLNGVDPEDFINEVTQGNIDFRADKFLKNMISILFKELYQNLGILIRLSVLIIICAILKNLQTAFLHEGVSEIAFYVCYVLIVTLLLVSFKTSIQVGLDAIDQMVGFMTAAVPVMITLLVSGGSATSAGVFQPFMLMIVEFSATIIKNVFFPMIFLSTILSIVNHITDKIHLTRLANLIRQAGTWALGIILTVFISAVLVQGSMGAVVDGVTTKAVKFAVSTFIPIVGKTLSDAAETVIACTLLIRNAAGIAVMLGILLICIVPLLKIIALVALYKTAGALFEPLAEKRIINCIQDISNSILYVFSVTAAIAFMFLISVTALIGAGNTSAMLR